MALNKNDLSTPISLRRIIFIVTMSLSTLSFGLTEAEVTTDNLNVRKSPNGAVVKQLSKYQKVKVIKEENGWSQVVFLSAGSESASFGWVSSQFIRLNFETFATDCTSSPEGAEHCVSIMEPSIQCKLGEHKKSYSACSISIRYELSNAENSFAAQGINCAADLVTKITTETELTSRKQSADFTFEETVSNGFRGSIKLDFVFSEEELVSLAQAGDAGCTPIFTDLADEYL